VYKGRLAGVATPPSRRAGQVAGKDDTKSQKKEKKKEKKEDKKQKKEQEEAEKQEKKKIKERGKQQKAAVSRGRPMTPGPGGKKRQGDDASRTRQKRPRS
jgi:hypothetical protein